MVWRKPRMYASGLGCQRRRITRGGITLGTDPCTSGGIVGVQRYKLHGHADGPSGTVRINAGEPVRVGGSMVHEDAKTSEPLIYLLKLETKPNNSKYMK